MNTTQNINPQDLTFEKVWLMFQEVSKKFKETDEKFKETDEKFKESKEFIDKVASKIDRLAEVYGGFINNISRSAENFFYEALANILNDNGKISINGYDFSFVFQRLMVGKKSKRKEFDIVLLNHDEKIMALVEVKMNFRLKDLENFINTVRQYVNNDSRFNGYILLLGIGAFDFESGVEEKAKDLGFFILKPNFSQNSVIFINTDKENLKQF
jgi:hypothetical protein